MLLGPSDALIANTDSGLSKAFSVPGIGPKGCVFEVAFMNFHPFCGSLRLGSSPRRLTVKAIRLRASTILLRTTRIATHVTRIRVGTSAFICGTKTCHMPPNSTLRRLMEGLPNTRIRRSKAVGVGNGRIGGVVVSNGRFFKSSAGVTVGGLPAGVIRGVHTCSERDSCAHAAKVSSNRRRAILSLNIGGNVGRN